MRLWIAVLVAASLVAVLVANPWQSAPLQRRRDFSADPAQPGQDQEQEEKVEEPQVREGPFRARSRRERQELAGLRARDAAIVSNFSALTLLRVDILIPERILESAVTASRQRALRNCSCGDDLACPFCNESPFPPYGDETHLPTNAARASRRGRAAQGSGDIRLPVSRLFCVGGLKREVFSFSESGGGRLGSRAWDQTTCVFRDLIWYPSKRRWLFVADPRRQPAWDFPAMFAHNRSRNPQRTTPDASWMLSAPIEIFDVRLPSGAGDIGVALRSALERFPLVADATRQSDRFWHVLAIHRSTDKAMGRCGDGPGGNYGHFLGDFAWPVYSMMANGRALAVDNSLIYVPIGHHCSVSSRFVEQGLASLSRRSLRELVSFSEPTQFPVLVAGDAQRWWFLRTDSMPFAEPASALLYRRFVAAVTGVAVSRVGQKLNTGGGPLILVRLKSNRHRLLNAVELVDFLRARYPEAKVFAYRPADLPRDAEMRLMSRTAVLITPPGGGSFGAIFLPHGAAAIFLDVCWPCRAKSSALDNGEKLYDPIAGKSVCCVKLESRLWGDMPIIDLYYTHRDRQSMYFDTAQFSGYVVLDHSFVVDLQQMAELTDEALDRTGYSHMVP
jgi:Glycosyltransferase 61